MTLFALIKDANIVSVFPSNLGRVDLPGIGQVSPPVAGWEGDGFQILEVAQVSVPEGKQRATQPIYELIGGVPTETTEVEDIPAHVPEEVTRRQFMMQLSISGLTATVEDWVAQQNELTQIEFRESSTFARSNPRMQDGFTALGLTTQQVDDFFVAAGAL